MYYPYFRGKQNELMVIRENAQTLKDASFIPIIEPVKLKLINLERALNEVQKTNGECIVIVNPLHGEHVTTNGEAIHTLINQKYNSFKGIIIGIVLTSTFALPKLKELCNKYKTQKIALIHYGSNNSKELSELATHYTNISHHIFIEQFCSKLYRRSFLKSEGTLVLIRDGFHQRKNIDYPDQEAFSDIHITFRDEGMHGFGDFLIVGDNYSIRGGQPGAVTIHVTYINRTNAKEMYICRFKSDDVEQEIDPAVKFAQALPKLVNEVNHTKTQILNTRAIKEFVDLNRRSHYPGLGYIKKISMQHHIETLAAYIYKS